VIVRAHCEEAKSVSERLIERCGVEIYAVQGGKIVAVLEAATEADLARQMDAMRAEPGVLLVNLVYHEVDMP